ncbi:MAG: hypothetical protein EZS28_012515 [Streblomastix strix]|uniref:Uncharacterized protein n=1 Tax=Streblomastix strix TaxID=222440 RepID=A0A5J4WC60_9EUKA|nr:MAG: hypothetical protein EZS28_012515 [Streblomastix strix]
MDAIQDHSKNARQFRQLDTQQTLTQGTDSSLAGEQPIEQLDLDVRILESIPGASMHEINFYATNMSNTQVQEVTQRAAQAPQLLQHTKISAADRQLLPPFLTIDTHASGIQQQSLEFLELGILTILYILEGNLTEALIDIVFGLVLALRQEERANMTTIRLFLGSTPIDSMEIATP